jgi:uncharacterized protein with FMN-binding domain
VRRITLFIMSTVGSLVLLFSYYTSRGATPAAAAGGPGSVGIVSSGEPDPAAAASEPAPTGSAPPPTGSAPAPSSTAQATRNLNLTVNGPVAQTRWGPMQVQVIITKGRITDVKPLQYPNGNSRDQEINSYALPALHDQVIAAQSANIDGVSGATVTSDGYMQSLQAALDTAHF